MYVGFSPGSGIADSRLVVLPGAAEGNAVVIIYEDKDGNGKYDPNTDKIKWSWHVWNTSYVPSTKWMDRHLGAMTNAPESPTDNLDTHGLFYQWGRKDPHPSSGLTTHSGYIETNSPYYTAPGVSGV